MIAMKRDLSEFKIILSGLFAAYVIFVIMYMFIVIICI